MRRLLIATTILLLCILMALPVLGANNASKVQIFATVQQNESCAVTATVTLHIEQNSGDLRFPIPLDATAVSLNGSRVWTSRDNQAQYIDLSSAVRNMTGDFTFTISYHLPDVIHTGAAGVTELQLPLLSGYEDPIALLEFSVTLPGEINAKPAFSSGYHQANIEKDLINTVQDNTVTGRSTVELKDHESLTMTLAVDKTLFPDAPLVFYESDADDVAMTICAVCALLYWLLTMRAFPVRHQHSASAPEGTTAGQLGAVMTLGKADLSLMVLSWAQLGYIQLERKAKGQVLLHKQMDMGNERTAFEQHCFRMLFGKRITIDTTSVFYATCCRKIAAMSPNLQSFVDRRSGNPRLFRALAALIALFGGVSFGIAMSQGAALQGFWIFLTAGFGLILGWYMQLTVQELLLRKSSHTLIGAAACVVWLLFGLLAGQFSIALTVMLLQWLAGLMTFFGGRRTEAGRQELARILGLRRYLNTVSKEDLRRIDDSDPDYFHNLIPYAIALGADRSFARRFGNDRIPPCPYLSMHNDQIHTAGQWVDILRQVLTDMNRRSRTLPMERFLELLSSFRSAPTKKSKKRK